MRHRLYQGNRQEDRKLCRPRSQESFSHQQFPDRAAHDRRYYGPPGEPKDAKNVRMHYRNKEDNRPADANYNGVPPAYPRPAQNQQKDPISSSNEQVQEHQKEERKSPVRKDKQEVRESKKLTESQAKRLKDCELIANIMKDYANLQNNEDIALNKLFTQKNFSIFNAFELLNPRSGLINNQSLLSALRDNLSIEIEDESIIDDLITR